MGRWLRIFALVVGVGSLLVAGFYAYVIFAVLDSPFDNRSFDRAVWAAYHESADADNPRGEMYEDLTENVLQEGMHRSKIIELLGPPDYREETHLVSYNLGMWSGFRIDYDTLDLELDNNGMLIRARRIQH